MQHTVSNLTVC